MATTTRRYGSGSGSGWHPTGTTNFRTTPKTKRTAGKQPVKGYEQTYNSFWTKISSYKTLYQQTWGPARYDRPKAATLNTFATWVNKGAVVQTVSCAQVAKWARATKTNFTTRNATTTACKNVLCNKFGKNTIKAVTRTKTGSYMVAAMPTWKGKTPSFPW